MKIEPDYRLINRDFSEKLQHHFKELFEWIDAKDAQISALLIAAERYRQALQSISQLKQVTFNQSPELHMALEIARKALSE